MAKEDRERTRLARAAGRRVSEKRAPGGKRGPRTVYLDERVFDTFKKKCEANNWSASEVIEDLIREFTTG